MTRQRVSCVLILLVVAWMTAGLGALAECTMIPVSPGASADGSAMTTHTDDSGTDTFYVFMVPAMDWEAGTTLEVLKNTDDGPFTLERTPLVSPGSIPQVAHTYAYTDASYSFQNENQVGMGESTIGGAREMRNSAGWFEVVELQRVALQRATTAREAIQIMGSLAEEYGYCVSGECITVIDPYETWLFEIFGPGPLWTPGSADHAGAVWIAQRVPDGEVSVSANRSRIGEINLDDPDHFMASSNVYSLAIELGMWDPNGDQPFKVYETYGAKAYSPYNARREWRVLSLLAPSLNLSPWLERYPFSVKPDEPVTVQKIMELERDAYQGTEFDLTQGLAAGPFGTPNRYPTSGSQNPEGSAGWERAISLFRTNFSTVVVARPNLPNWIGGLTWFGYDAPHSTCYMPIYCSATELPESFTVGSRGGEYDIFSRESAWWAFNFVSNWADLKFSYMIEDIKAVRDPIEAEFFTMQPFIEDTALALYEQDPDLARSFLTTYTNASANRVVDAYWDLANQLVGRYADGYVYNDETNRSSSVGYPQEWLDNVGFGLSTIIPEEGLLPGIDDIEQ